jgi:ABC-2 type transport system permease protein
LLPVITFARIDLKRLFRDKVAIFFVFIFPLIFLFVFGGLFGRDSSVSFDVAIINQSDSSFAKEFNSHLKHEKIFKIKEDITSIDQAREKMNRSEIDGTIILPPNFGKTNDRAQPTGQAQILYDQNNEQAGQALSSILETMLKDISEKIIPAQNLFSVKSESTATKGLSQFDYAFAGLLGFSVLSLGIFGPTNVFPRLKQRGVLRRYSTTTLKVWQYFLSNVLSQMMVGILSVGLLFIVAKLVFHLNMRGDYLSLAAIVVLGTGVLFGIGLAIGGWARNENQAAPLANLLSFPMMFLSGTFFPRFLMPEWLQHASALLPLTPVIDGARLIITEGKTIFEIGPQVGLLALWGVVIYVIALRVFRWE